MAKTPLHRLPRLYIETPLAPGPEVASSEEQLHYLKNVMRREIGDEVLLFNGQDGEWHASIKSLSKDRAFFGLIEQTRKQAHEPDVWLFFAPLKRAHTDFMIEKASELGAARLCPVMTAHTNAERVNTDRLRVIAIEAAEQCERLSIPEVAEPVTFDAMIKNFPPDRVLLFCAEAGAVMPIGEALRKLAPAGLTWRKAAILIGPEGGFNEQELQAARALRGTVAVSLGPRILRADTAAISALSCWQSFHGDWPQATAARPTYS
ncbi:MAG: 16S rRNA (uracil(1498)-N(3))-methyltransferase [Alphaproteobacteria bacterium]|nr:16S rRNA (uracil(1498)-N(3))-methyltransferase [Alphaproteobacteria bacterium]